MAFPRASCGESCPGLRPGTSRFSLIVPALLAFATPSTGQTPNPEANALAEARRQAVMAGERSGQLEAQAARASADAVRARAAAAAVAARIQAAEADIALAHARIRMIEGLRARQRARLAARQGPIVRLVAALQTMARRPPALVLVQPGSLTDLVHVRSLLATTLPIVQARTAGLRAEVEAGNRLRREADRAVATLRAGQKQLQARRLELAKLEVAHRRRSQRFVDAAMFEQDRAISLGEQARDIVDLMRNLDLQSEQRDRLAELPGPPFPARQGRPCSASPPGTNVAPPIACRWSVASSPASAKFPNPASARAA